MAQSGPDEEVERYRSLLRDKPDSLVFAALIEALRKRGELDEAIVIGEAGVERHPEYVGGLLAFAKVLYDGGHEDRALEYTSRILGHSRENLAALRLKGQIDQGRGQLSAAIKTYKRILELYPKDLATQSLLRSLEERREQPADEAAGGGAKASRDGESERIRLATMTLIELFAEQGYKKRARQACRRMLAVDPTRQDVMRKLVELGERRISSEWAAEPSVEK